MDHIVKLFKNKKEDTEKDIKLMRVLLRRDTIIEVLLDTVLKGASNIWSVTENNQTDHILGVVLTQYSLKLGLARFQEKGEESTLAEM